MRDGRTGEWRGDTRIGRTRFGRFLREGRVSDRRFSIVILVPSWVFRRPDHGSRYSTQSALKTAPQDDPTAPIWSLARKGAYTRKSNCRRQSPPDGPRSK